MKIHIAGWPVKVGSRGRQLCAWCGVVLFDVDHDRIMVASGGDGPRPWEVGELIATDGYDPRYPVAVAHVVPHEDGAQLPLNCCASPPVKLELVKDAADGEGAGNGEDADG